MFDMSLALSNVASFASSVVVKMVRGWVPSSVDALGNDKMRKVLADLPRDGGKDALWFVAGVTAKGVARYECLDQMPHLLVAGTTGSGKSVFINTLLASLLTRHGADSLRLGIVDPKRVEFAMYSGLPHLMAPIADEVRGASGIMAQAVDEMERRLTLFVRAGVKDLASYVRVTGEEMPRYVIIVDEFADLILASKKDKESKGYGASFEMSITRIAQKARAAGIHLVLATQKPIVKVVDSLLKGNIPARVAFRVTNEVESRVILDESGAEELRGRGDMMFRSPVERKAEHMQGVWFPDDDLRKLVKGG